MRQYSLMSNSLLFKKLVDDENGFMSRRLNNVKSSVDRTSPESFNFSKERTKSSHFNFKNFNEEYERKKQNEYLVKKLTLLYIQPLKRPNSNANFIRKIKNKENINNNIFKNSSRKWEILKISQDNQNFHKKLLESKPAFTNIFNISKTNFNKKEKKVVKSAKNLQNDKINLEKEMDEFKAKTNEDFFKIKIQSHKSKKKPEENILHSVKKNDNEFIKKCSESNTFTQIDKTKNTNKIKILYKRKAFLNKLALVEVTFMLKNHRFIIKVDPISIHPNKLFIISFETVDDVLLMRKTYRNYENIINDLHFDGINIIIKNKKAELVYITKLISKNKAVNTEEKV